METICKFPGFSVYFSPPQNSPLQILNAKLICLPGLSALPLHLRESTGLCLGLPSLHHRLETLSRQQTGTINGFAPLASHLLRISVLSCPMFSVLKLLFHIFCFIIFDDCFRWEDKFSTCYSKLPSRSPCAILVFIFKFPVWFFSLTQSYLVVCF